MVLEKTLESPLHCKDKKYLPDVADASAARVRSGLGGRQWCGVSAGASPGLRAPSRRPAPLLSPTSPLELPVGPQGCGRWALCLSFRLGRGGPRGTAGSVSAAARALFLGLGEALQPTSHCFPCGCHVRSPLGSCSSGGVVFPACVTWQTV